MLLQTASQQMQAIYNDAMASSAIENPTDADWSRLCELYQRFIEEMDDREIDPPEISESTIDIDALAESLARRMHTS